MRGNIKLWCWMNGRQPDVQYWKWPTAGGFIWEYKIDEEC